MNSWLRRAMGGCVRHGLRAADPAVPAGDSQGGDHGGQGLVRRRGRAPRRGRRRAGPPGRAVISGPNRRMLATSNVAASDRRSAGREGPSPGRTGCAGRPGRAARPAPPRPIGRSRGAQGHGQRRLDGPQAGRHRAATVGGDRGPAARPPRGHSRALGRPVNADGRPLSSRSSTAGSGGGTRNRIPGKSRSRFGRVYRRSYGPYTYSGTAAVRASAWRLARVSVSAQPRDAGRRLTRISSTSADSAAARKPSLPVALHLGRVYPRFIRDEAISAAAAGVAVDDHGAGLGLVDDEPGERRERPGWSRGTAGRAPGRRWRGPRRTGRVGPARTGRGPAGGADPSARPAPRGRSPSPARGPRRRPASACGRRWPSRAPGPAARARRRSPRRRWPAPAPAPPRGRPARRPAPGPG